VTHGDPAAAIASLTGAYGCMRWMTDQHSSRGIAGSALQQAPEAPRRQHAVGLKEPHPTIKTATGAVLAPRMGTTEFQWRQRRGGTWTETRGGRARILWLDCLRMFEAQVIDLARSEPAPL